MKKKTTVSALVGTVVVLAAFAVFVSSPAKNIPMSPDGVKCTLGKDGTLITCTWD